MNDMGDSWFGGLLAVLAVAVAWGMWTTRPQPMPDWVERPSATERACAVAGGTTYASTADGRYVCIRGARVIEVAP